MRDQGRLTDWNDDKGFGFVTPDSSGLRAFVHIRAFSYRHRRPRNGDVITYQLGWDPKGRPRAENVLFREIKLAPRHAEGNNRATSASGGAAYAFSALFLIGIVALAANGKLPWIVPQIYGVVSLLLFFAYAFDKMAAMNRRWRTKEETLQLMALAGGWPGALVAQRMFRHKSRKESFQSVFRAIVIIHLVGLTMFILNFPMGSVLMKISEHFSS